MSLSLDFHHSKSINRGLGVLLLLALVSGASSPLRAQNLALPAAPSLESEAGDSQGDATTTGADESVSEEPVFKMPESGKGKKGGLGLSLPTEDFMMPEGNVLKGRVTETPRNSPILYGSVQTIPKNTRIDMTLDCFLNSELSQKGDQVFARISRDVVDEDNGKVFLPGNWVAHGYITEVDKQKHNGRDGVINVKFDRLISPDQQYDLPFETTFSTRDNQLKAVARTVYRDTVFTAKGGVAGALISLQMTGLPLAISSYGGTVAGGAAIGGTYGAICAYVRKGKIAASFPGDHIKLKISEPLSLPGFNPLALDSARNKSHVAGLKFKIDKFKFQQSPITRDKHGQVLTITFTAANTTRKPYALTGLRVVSDFNDIYERDITAHAIRVPPLLPGKTQSLTLPFLVDGKNLKYSLVLYKDGGEELARTGIN